MLEVVGAIALTLMLGYVTLFFGAMSLFCFLGFDEVNIPMGFVLLIPTLLAVVSWWFLVGTHISIGLS